MAIEKFIEKRNFQNFIDVVCKEYEIFAPVMKEGNVVFQETSQSKDILFEYVNSKTNPKALFFPQSESLFHFKKDMVIENPLPERKFIVFGIRPCDVQGIRVIDKVYGSEDFKDVYYLSRRENAVLISMACTGPDDTCFCSGVNGGIAEEEGSDIMAYDSGDAIIMKAITNKGEGFIRQCDKVLKNATKPNVTKAVQRTKEAAKRMDTKIDAGAVKKNLDKHFDHMIWKQISDKCIGCGICTYFCPTCYCFDITDEMRGEDGKRLRSWDSCMFRLFTLHGSGHNPRTTQKERFRQRVMHKFKYLLDNCQILGCTGCGRCVRECPVNLDIREVVNDVAKIKS